MLQISTHPHSDKSEHRTHLARLRREARQRGFRVLKDWSGRWSLVDARIEPQRALFGLLHVPLLKIECALATPLPAPKPRRRRTITVTAAEADQEADALLAHLLTLQETDQRAQGNGAPGAAGGGAS
jgi:isopenicillin N synthase-like dioxygenase